MRLALSAGGAPESVAYVQVLLGDLELARGRSAAARDAVPHGAGRRAGLPAGDWPGSHAWHWRAAT